MRFPPFNPYIAVVVGVIAIASTAIFVKLLTSVPAGTIAFYRLIFAAILMAPWVFVKYRLELRSISLKNLLFALFSGLFLALHLILWYESFNYTSVASSVVLMSLQPIFLFLGTYFFIGERFTGAAIISIFIAVVGSFLVSWGDFQIDELFLFGDILAMLAAVSITGYFLTGQQLRRNVSLITYTFIVYIAGTFFLLIYNLLMRNSLFHHTEKEWLFLLLLAVIPTFLGHFVFNWVLKWLRTSTISLATVFVPIVAAFLAYLLLDELVTPQQWLGGSILIFGIFLFIVSTTRKKQVTISHRNGFEEQKEESPH